jgi:glycolate oxidase subunit GlcD
LDTLIENLREVVGREAVLCEADELLVFECDGLPQHKYPPRAVVFPASTEEVSDVLRVLARERISFAPRGAGTGLSGGALAVNRGVIIELARMRRLLKLDAENCTARVETGMVNAHLSRAVAAYGLHYVPDPSSQMTCTIGGNIAENAGGIHCLKYGMTVDHVLSIRVVLAGGEVVELGGTGTDSTGYDLRGLFIGSEGTFGIATEATLRLIPLPSAVRTLLADFASVDEASHAVSAIIAAGLIPAALEMVDGATIRAVEASVFAAGLPLDAEAALLIELDGLNAGLNEEAARAESLCRQYGARGVHLARDEAERKRFWAARKGAFGAMGRISPDLMLQDAVVPRSRLPQVLASIYSIGAKYNLRLANLFHAGDGNLHPVICFDSRQPDEIERVKEAGREIMETCVRAGGTITGEHGVGLDKSEYLPLVFSADDMDVMLRVRSAFDPTGLCNPGKIIPTPRTCSEARIGKKLTAGNKQWAVEAIAPNQEYGSLKVRTVKAQSQRTTRSSQPASLLSQIVGAGNVAVSTPHRFAVSPPRPATSTCLTVAPASAEEACEVLRLSTSEGWAVVPAGAETWLDAGNPLRRADVIISAGRMQRIKEHEPADLVATVEAGATLDALNTELGSAGQWLALDPPDDGSVTLGGIVATGIGGAQSYGFGRPRDSVIGMRVALADGRIIKAGGRVVKNVAGYDLCKLFTGSYGTLCLILELTFKLRPRPARTATVVLRGPLDSLLRAGRATLDARLLPVAVELLSESVARRLLSPVTDAQPVLLIRYAGQPETVAYQTESTVNLLRNDALIADSFIQEDDAAYWRGLAALSLEESNELVWRTNLLPTRLGEFLEQAWKDEGAAFSSSSLWHAGVATGSLRVMNTSCQDGASGVASLERLRARALKALGALIIERASPEIRNSIDAWGNDEPNLSLMRRVKKELDASDTFSPGRFRM